LSGGLSKQAANLTFSVYWDAGVIRWQGILNKAAMLGETKDASNSLMYSIKLPLEELVNCEKF
jgi:hypothetical protein